MRFRIHSIDWFIVITFISLLIKALVVNRIFTTAISQGAFLSTIGILFAFLSFSLLFKQPLRIAYLIAVNLVVSFVLFSDLVYFRYFGSPITMYLFLQTSNLEGLGPSILSLIQASDILFFIDIPVILGAYLFLKSEHPLLGIKKRVYLFSSLLIVGILLVSLKPVKIHMLDQRDPFKKFTPLSYMIDWGPMGHHVFDAADFVRDSRTINLTAEEEKMINDWFDTRLGASTLSQDELFGAGKGKNLIVIQVESLQNFVINQQVEGKEITPVLNSLLDNSLYFSNFYPQTAEGNSSDAELLVNTSLYPVREGSTFFRYGHHSYPSLAKLLAEDGYQSIALHADDGSFWNRELTYPNLGFDTFYDIASFKRDDMIGMGLSDKSFFTQSIPFLKELPEPFYSFYVTLTSHTPYEIPDAENGLQLSEELATSHLGNYFESIHYTDSAIGEFIDQLKKEQLLDDTIIVLYGDHDGLFYHRDLAEIEDYYDKKITQEEWMKSYTQVPFIIYHPEFEGKTVTTIGGQIDALPTIAHIMGIETAAYGRQAMGRNLLKDSQGSAILMKGDYGEKTYVHPNGITFGLVEEQEKALEVSELLIRSNYFVRKK
ncbi:LTA synthase family protein [Bacillus sp. PS06]|uniref:LTA synthase family protein n=1 Tax=Bacillus sp. PS06 TaxID=2764176 RepID=UPI00177D386C|nr:LTA synthase family protein [Bacillus sp. PS06]MBD8070547.1 LTA synthase family protein [Bacillus sp. PS06]